MAELVVLLLGSALTAAAPLILAGLGELALERSGAGFNLGIEGILLCGALAGVLVGAAAGPWAGVAAGLGVGLLFGLGYAACAALGVDVVLIGITISIVGAGVSTYLFQVIAPAGRTNISSPLLPTVRIPGLSELPVLGPPFHAVSTGFVLAAGMAALTAWALRSTRYGLRLRSAANARTAAAQGISVARHRLLAALIAGGLAGVAGAVLAIATIGTFTPLMSGGRGFLVLAVVIIGRRTAGGVVAGALLFAGMDGLAVLAETRDLGLPSEAYHALPYFAALVVLCAHARWEARRAAKIEKAVTLKESVR
ncbi:ABC transporter permease [Amycolatopsis sp. cmx-4-61]|uniref:ABC transporter permease n=1 Tax=Amycolatopsis sp. cmx-4-61 TaxID=2790937 RepID=UPI00397AD562